MYNKKKLSLILAAVMISVSSCGKKTKEPDKKVIPSCTMAVNSHYSGWGEDGGFLGEGEYDETFTITSGDIFYETYDGHWVTEQRDKYPYDVIAEIKSVDGSEIVWSYNGSEYHTRYDRCSEVNSMYTVFDGINYDYKVTFSDYSEK